MQANEMSFAEIKELGDGSITHKDEAGKTKTYYPVFNRVTLKIKSIEIITSVRQCDSSPPCLVTHLQGMAILENRSISLLGDSKSKTNKLEISFREAKYIKPEKKEKIEEPETRGSFPSLHVEEIGSAVIGFAPYDWEIGVESLWFIECHVPKDVIENLSKSIVSGNICDARILVSLRGLYSVASHWEPISIAEKADLFIRPRISDNCLSSPEFARGEIAGLRFSSCPVVFFDEKPNNSLGQESKHGSDREDLDALTAALSAIELKISETKSVLKWLVFITFLSAIIVAV